MRDNDPGIFGVFPEGTGNLDAGKELPARGYAGLSQVGSPCIALSSAGPVRHPPHL